MTDQWTTIDIRNEVPPPDGVVVWMYCEQRSYVNEIPIILGYYDAEDGMFYSVPGGAGYNNMTHWRHLNKPKNPALTEYADTKWYRETQ